MEKKILIVDDDTSFSKMIYDYFRSHNYHVFTADEMTQAVSICKKEKPKVVLLDFKMPLITGEQLLLLLQSVHPEMQVIVISGCIGEEVEEKFRGLGYFAYFEKGGLSLEQLKHKVDEAMNY